MVKVLLVEDEIPARTVFRHMIEAYSDGLFTLVGEAEDGGEGLELFRRHKPQLIVTDITMPGMSGLDMLHEIEQSGEGVPQAVILTSHKDFHYAQQAIQLKAAAYLIKDDCLSDPELLPRTMEGLARQAVSQDESREKQLQLEQKVRASEMEIERSTFLNMLRSPEDEAAWLQSLESAQIPVRSGRVHALLLELDRSSLRFSIDQQEELKLWQFAGVNVLKELLGDCGPNKVIALDKGRFFAIYAPAGGVAQAQAPASGLLAHIVQAFTLYLKMSALGLEFTFEHGLAAQLPELKKLVTAAYPFFYRSQAVIARTEWAELAGFQHVPEHFSRLWIKILKQALLEPLRSAAALEQERSSFFRQAMEQRWDPEQIKSLYLRVFLDISHFTADSEAAAELEAAFRKKLEQCQTFHDVHDTTFLFFRRLQGLQGDGKTIDASISRMIQRMHEDLSYPYKLEELAESINYSVPYFSSMFKKTTGESFVQYVTRLRVEKAKLLLLTTDQKTFEIAESIGFENYRSFNRIFKKETGVTPSDFRRMHQEQL
ncbi:helix-turn-helix domain-containing protein [Paenibacillus whitsoniae]|uniref:Helix-turn-helix domain-containing protein n=1 Tax=Paenibacillus whitsoniae TaxID=2496558 RepID=A0A3S0CDS6_9BACL|nr:helix-turn-helix domain-containing protein [Paenibacillus whitsoniae]RTE11659.1 helix-turn-helix domain-containing protein [Paenibacillus whitsoniae]